MTENGTLQAIEDLADKIFDVAPGDMEAHELLSALALVAAFTICHTAANRVHALDGANVFYNSLTRFIVKEFDIVSGADTGGVH